LSKELTKEKLAEIMEPLLERFQVPIKRALSETGLSGSDFYAVEIVGGSMRIPAFKVAAAQAAGVYKDDPNENYGLKNTMDMEEAASHGAAMKSALLSPKFRLQTKFDIVDTVQYPIKITWETKEGNELPILGLPPLPLLPEVDGVEDQLMKCNVTGAKDGGNVVQPIGSTSSCVLFDRNSKCGGVVGRGIGDRTLSFRRNQVRRWMYSFVGPLYIVSSPHTNPPFKNVRPSVCTGPTTQPTFGYLRNWALEKILLIVWRLYGTQWFEDPPPYRSMKIDKHSFPPTKSFSFR
jgi:hypothetical protein